MENLHSSANLANKSATQEGDFRESLGLVLRYIEDTKKPFWGARRCHKIKKESTLMEVFGTFI